MDIVWIIIVWIFRILVGILVCILNGIYILEEGSMNWVSIFIVNKWCWGDEFEVGNCYGVIVYSIIWFI